MIFRLVLMTSLLTLAACGEKPAQETVESEQPDMAAPAAVAAAKAHAAVNRQKKVDRKSRSEVVANSKVDAVEVGAAKRRASTRMADINSETLEVRAAAVDPPRQPLGLIDSEQRQPASKEDLTQECEARGLEPKSGALRMKPRVSGGRRTEAKN